MANASSTLRGVTHFTYGTELEWLAKHKIIHYALERMGFDHNVRPGSSDARTADVKFTEAGVSKDAPDSNGYKRGNIKPEAVLEDVMDPAGGGYCENQPPRSLEPLLLPKTNGKPTRSLTLLRRGHGIRFQGVRHG